MIRLSRSVSYTHCEHFSCVCARAAVDDHLFASCVCSNVNGWMHREQRGDVAHRRTTNMRHNDHNTHNVMRTYRDMCAAHSNSWWRRRRRRRPLVAVTCTRTTFSECTGWWVVSRQSFRRTIELVLSPFIEDLINAIYCAHLGYGERVLRYSLMR